MPALPEIRRKAFFTVDRLRGAPIARHIAEVESVVIAPDSRASRLLREEYLQSLLRHAVDTVPHYQAIRPQGELGYDLETFPVVSKHTIQRQPDALLSGAFDAAELPQVETSGSSGTPFVVPRDPLKRQRHIADLIAFGRLANYEFGDPVVFLSVSRGIAARRSLRHRLQEVHYVPGQVFDAGLADRWLAAVSQAPRPLTLVGFPSALEFIGRQLQDSGRELPRGKVGAAIAISEAMTPWLSANCEEVFGVPAVSRYSNEESGIFAQQTDSSDGRFVVNHASYVVEILAMDSDQPAAVGEVGRIVVTDLFARAMPLIRYDTGDLGRLSPEHPQQLAEVVGRQMDIIYGDRGQLVAPAAVLFKLFGFEGIRQFQFAQTGRLTHQLRLVAEPDPARDVALQAALRELLGPEAVISVEYVDGVEAMPSGKRRPVANLWAEAPRAGSTTAED